MKLRYILLFALLGFILTTLWLIHGFYEVGEMRATGEEWEKISNGYVSD